MAQLEMALDSYVTTLVKTMDSNKKKMKNFDRAGDIYKYILL